MTRLALSVHPLRWYLLPFFDAYTLSGGWQAGFLCVTLHTCHAL